MSSFIRAANPIWWIPDYLTGLPLDDTYYAFFLNNLDHTQFFNVYNTPNGTPYANPLQFQPGGTLPNNLYFDPMLTYCIQIRQGDTPLSPLLYEIDNFTPENDQLSIQNSFIGSQNLITDPQFADVLFSSPMTITTAGTYEIAPGWFLQLIGTGTCILTQDTITGQASSVGPIPGNPPYDLSIETSGTWSQVFLYQQLLNNGAIAANGSIAVTFVAEAITNPYNISLNYINSQPPSGTEQLIHTWVVGAGAFATYAWQENINPSDNTTAGQNAYVYLSFTLQNTGTIKLSNIQVLAQTAQISGTFSSASLPLFIQPSYAQIVNGEFNYYLPQLLNERIPSYLVGWDFPLNPVQFLNTVGNAGANKSFYAIDQTIVYDSLSAGTTVSIGTASELVLTCNTTGNQAAIIQYIPAAQANELLNSAMAINIAAKCSNAAGLAVTVSLYYTTGALPVTVGAPHNSIVATLDANGKPATFNGTWVEIPQSLINSQFTIQPNATTAFNDYQLNGWNNMAVNNATFMAIVVGFAAMTAADTVNILSVGLMAGSIATRPAPQTEDEVLRECEYYFETSYDTSIINSIPPAAAGGGIFFEQLGYTDGANVSLVPRAFGWQFNVHKWSIPVILLFSPTSSALNQVRAYIKANGNPITNTDYPTTNWNPLSSSRVSVNFDAANIVLGLTTSNAGVLPEAYILLGYQADSRLGRS
jgi:hypothetical protein